MRLNVTLNHDSKVTNYKLLKVQTKGDQEEIILARKKGKRGGISTARLFFEKTAITCKIARISYKNNIEKVILTRKLPDNLEIKFPKTHVSKILKNDLPLERNRFNSYYIEEISALVG